MNNPFIATIIEFGGNFAPRGWAFCHGQLLAISGNDALFSLIGTIYGGDGRTTFGLPDLRGRVAIHAGNGPGLTDRRLGAKGGSETNVLTTAQIPSHGHTGTLHVSSANSTQGAATQGSSVAAPGTLSGRTFTPTEGFNAAAPDITLNGTSVSTGFTGNNASVNDMEPFETVNYIIALVGVYPSRS